MACGGLGSRSNRPRAGTGIGEITSISWDANHQRARGHGATRRYLTVTHSESPVRTRARELSQSMSMGTSESPARERAQVIGGMASESSPRITRTGAGATAHHPRLPRYRPNHSRARAQLGNERLRPMHERITPSGATLKEWTEDAKSPNHPRGRSDPVEPIKVAQTGSPARARAQQPDVEVEALAVRITRAGTGATAHHPRRPRNRPNHPSGRSAPDAGTAAWERITPPARGPKPSRPRRRRNRDRIAHTGAGNAPVPRITLTRASESPARTREIRLSRC